MKTKNFLHRSRVPYDGPVSPPLILFVAALAARPVRVALAFTPDRDLSPLAVVTAVREAAALWSCCGVAVEVAQIDDLDRHAMRVMVAWSRNGRVRTGEALGAVRFQDGIPAPIITIYLDDLLRLIERTRVAGAAGWQWPRRMRERIVGRALGRVLAHEIGHIVLQTRSHSATGLMRSSHAGADLIEPGRRRFALNIENDWE